MRPDADQLVSNEEFAVPENNAFGNSFRDYEADGARKDTVEQHYQLSHINQTNDFVKRIREEYKKLDKAEMGIWESCELLNEVIDDSDPDLDEPQIQHLLQSAEAIRKDYPNEDWLHLTALIHDLGKILVLPKFGKLAQWAVVGDTFPVDEFAVHKLFCLQYSKGKPRFQHPKFNTKNGVYSEGCGLDKAAKENGSTLPSAGLFIIRYHSFYPLHKHGAYTQSMNKEDKENMKWLKVFNKYDLYSKSKVLVNVEEVKPYYESLIAKEVTHPSTTLSQAHLTMEFSRLGLPKRNVHICDMSSNINPFKLSLIKTLRWCPGRSPPPVHRRTYDRKVALIPFVNPDLSRDSDQEYHHAFALRAND
ncbi:hypothetical protein DITRI_Ditri06bG0018600 [Diplodiscus trichospermus]